MGTVAQELDPRRKIDRLREAQQLSQLIDDPLAVTIAAEPAQQPPGTTTDNTPAVHRPAASEQAENKTVPVPKSLDWASVEQVLKTAVPLSIDELRNTLHTSGYAVVSPAGRKRLSNILNRAARRGVAQLTDAGWTLVEQKVSGKSLQPLPRESIRGVLEQVLAKLGPAKPKVIRETLATAYVVGDGSRIYKALHFGLQAGWLVREKGRYRMPDADTNTEGAGTSAAPTSGVADTPETGGRLDAMDVPTMDGGAVGTIMELAASVRLTSGQEVSVALSPGQVVQLSVPGNGRKALQMQASLAELRWLIEQAEWLSERVEQ